MAYFKDGTRRETAEFLADVLEVSADEGQRALDEGLGAFLQHTEPEETFHMELITMNMKGGGSLSRKPGNFTLNWRKFFEIGPDAAMAVWGATTPMRGTVVALYLWNKVRNGLSIPVPEECATLMEAMWFNEAGRVRLNLADVPVLVEKHCLASGLSVPGRVALDDGLNWLERHRCVKLDQDTVWLREWVRRQV